MAETCNLMILKENVDQKIDDDLIYQTEVCYSAKHKENVDQKITNDEDPFDDSYIANVILYFYLFFVISLVFETLEIYLLFAIDRL
jgi:hypothetical protein